MHAIIALLFAITVGFAFVEDRLKENQKVMILIGYVVFMVFFATTKSIEHTADALMYEYFFYKNDDLVIQYTTEPTYIYLSRMVLALGGTISVMFFIYALISIPAKMKILYSTTPFVFTALMIYIPVYFELHDMIQIRVAAAAVFLLASLIPLSEGHKWRATLLILCAILFHYSSVVYLPFVLVGNRKLSLTARIIIAALFPVCFAMYLLKLDLISLIPTLSSSIGYKIEQYKESTEKGQWDELRPLYANLYYVSKVAMLYVCLYFYDFLTEKHRMAPILITLFSVSVLFLPAMATIPVIGSRVSDLFGLVDCLIFTFLLYLVEPKYWARIAIAILGIYMLIYNIAYTEYFT